MALKIDLTTAPRADGTLYPPPFDEPCRARQRITRRRRWIDPIRRQPLHVASGDLVESASLAYEGDELVYVVSGEVVLVTDSGEETLRAGDSAGFKAGHHNGHHFQNRSAIDAVIVEIGTRVGGAIIDC